METHDDFARARLLRVESRQTWKVLWDNLNTDLNNLQGPSKSATKWQRAWVHIKNKIKRKASEIRQFRMATEEGPEVHVPWSDFDERCLNLLSEEAVYGIQGPDEVVLVSENPKAVDDPRFVPSWELDMGQYDGINTPPIVSCSSAETSDNEEELHLPKR